MISGKMGENNWPNLCFISSSLTKLFNDLIFCVQYKVDVRDHREFFRQAFAIVHNASVQSLSDPGFGYTWSNSSVKCNPYKAQIKILL